MPACRASDSAGMDLVGTYGSGRPPEPLAADRGRRGGISIRGWVGDASGEAPHSEYMCHLNMPISRSTKSKKSKAKEQELPQKW